MIDRYSITTSFDKITRRFEADAPDVLSPRFNASPTQLLPVITTSSPQGVSVFYWGTSPAWSKNKPLSEKIINTHAEQILDKTSLKKALQKNRCIILSDGFYGWKKAGKKTFIPYRFICTDQEVFSYAGLWEEYEDTDGVSFHTFSIITTQANTLVRAVQDRMPVIFSRKEEMLWLNKDTSEEALMNLLKPYAADKMNHYSVSPRISDPATDVPSLIIPAPASDQFGNLTLFD